MMTFTKLHTQIKWVTSECPIKIHENPTSDPAPSSIWELVNLSRFLTLDLKIMI
jgi:hypothetical protein